MNEKSNETITYSSLWETLVKSGALDNLSQEQFDEYNRLFYRAMIREDFFMEMDSIHCSTITRLLDVIDNDSKILGLDSVNMDLRNDQMANFKKLYDSEFIQNHELRQQNISVVDQNTNLQKKVKRRGKAVLITMPIAFLAGVATTLLLIIK